jgi:hypothetical protein
MCFRSNINADNLYISGLTNDPLFGDGLYAMPNAMDTEITEIESNAMEAVMDGALQGDAMEADRSQDNAMEANVIYADAFNGVADNEDAFENDLFDGEALEMTSQGKNLPSPLKFAPEFTNNYLIESDSTNQSSSQIEASDLDTTPTVFINNFSFGHAGAPIAAPHHSAVTWSGVTPPGDSIWAPFCSQRDWEIAQWAKMHGLTSLAFLVLLAINEVRVFDLSNYCTNIGYRSLSGLNYHTIV